MIDHSELRRLAEAANAKAEWAVAQAEVAAFTASREALEAAKAECEALRVENANLIGANGRLSGDYKDLNEDAITLCRQIVADAGLPATGFFDDVIRNVVDQLGAAKARIAKLEAVGRKVVGETHAIHDSDPRPQKYRAPYGSVAYVRELLDKHPLAEAEDRENQP